ncbi:MAG: DUF4321 domain-containing protein [Clostridia bacterium]|nr:DUF4321 domain-containing protein [Clostridia bacterium]
MRKSFWLTFFLVCVGVVIGEMVAEMTASVPYLSFLSYGLDFGTESPISIDLNILRFTFGINIKITISTIIFIVLSLVLGRVIAKD